MGKNALTREDEELRQAAETLQRLHAWLQKEEPDRPRLRSIIQRVQRVVQRLEQGYQQRDKTAPPELQRVRADLLWLDEHGMIEPEATVARRIVELNRTLLPLLSDHAVQLQHPRPRAVDGDSLPDTDVLHTVPASEMQEMLRRSPRRTYRRGEVIAGVEEDRDDVLLLARGRVRLYRVSPEGREITLVTMVAGDLFSPVFAGSPEHTTTTVQVLESETEVIHIPFRRFSQLVMTHPEVAVSSVELLIRRLVDAYNLVEDLSFHDVRVRLAHVLAGQARQDAHQVVSATHEELAAMVGASREEVTKALQVFRDQGLVRYPRHHHRIHVPDIDVLQALSTSDSIPDEQSSPVTHPRASA